MANTGNVFIDVLAHRSWLEVGGDRHITYYFDEVSPYRLWNNFEKAVWRAALQQWVNVANITTQELSSSTGADFIETWTNSQTMTSHFGLGPNGAPWAAAHYLPLAGGNSEGLYNTAYTGALTTQASLTPGGYGWWIFVHEIGHGLGLSHPHGMVQLQNEPFFPGVNAAGDLGEFGYNQQVNTIMSYNGPPHAAAGTTSPANTYGLPASPMAFDIAAIQHLYGPNTNFHNGEDTYVLPDENAPGTVWHCIWDTGGVDTVTYDGKRNGTIDLRAATLVFGDPIAGGGISKAAGILGGFTIAKGVVIENAVGGSGNDTLFGNSSDNLIDGRAGDDSVVYAGVRSAYTIADLGGGSIRVTGPDGTDHFANVERIVFSDTTVNLTSSAPPPPSSFTWSSRTQAADFNGDGKADILWQNDSGAPGVWLMDGINLLGAGPALLNPGTSWREKAAADFNGDGKADILWQNDNGTPGVWLMDGVNVLAPGPALMNPGPSWHAKSAADFNGDGKADILWQNDNGTPGVWLMDGVNVLAPGPALLNPGPSWHALTAADFNGDGKADILWQNDNGTPAVWLMDGVNVLAPGPALLNPGPSWHALTAADFNGDGNADILWQNDNGTPAVWLMDGVNILATGPALTNPGLSWHALSAGDFNGDGKADILWQNDNGTPDVWLMDGTSVLMTGGALLNPGPSWHIV